MKKNVKVLSLVLSISMAISLLTACGGKEETAKPTSTQEAAATAKPLDPVTLKFMMRGAAPNQMQVVLDEMKKKMANTINTTIEFDWVNGADQATKIRLVLAAQEDYAGIFDAPFITYTENMGKNMYAPLESYFNNDKYPGLKKAFAKEVIENNKDNGHNLFVPLIKTLNVQRYFIVRKDLRVKYGMSELKTMEDLEKFCDNVLSKEKGMIPYAANSGLVIYDRLLDTDYRAKYKDTIGELKNFFSGDNLPTFALLNADKKTVKSIYFPGDADDKLAAFPQEYKENMYAGVKKSADWYAKGYISKDIATIKDQNPDFYAGKYAMAYSDSAGFSTMLDKVKASNPGADLEIVLINNHNNLTANGVLATNYRANNLIGIPAYSKKIERTMLYFDWLFSSAENHDLLEFGIEGKHWEKVGTDRYKTPAGIDLANNYNFPSYRMTDNSNYVRQQDGLHEMFYKVSSFDANTKSYYLDPLKGFTFSTEPVKAEWAKVLPVFNDEGRPTRLGMVPDYAASYKALNEKASKLGLENIRAELKKQIEAYLAKN